MARIRSIKPEFWASESLGTRLCGPDGRQARLLFIALWNHAEDHGVCRAAPALLRSVAFPYDEDVTAGDVSRWLRMLDEGGFIVRYERNESSYLWIRSFDEHQRIDRKSKTTLPEPSHDDMMRRTSPRRVLDESSLQEGKGREEEGRGLDPAAQVVSAVAVPPAAKEQVALFPTPTPEKPKRPPTAVAQWFETAVETRKGRVPADAPQDVDLKKHQWPKLGEAFKTHGALTLTAAFGLFLAAPGYPQEHAYPMGLFVSQVDEWISRAQAAAAKARTQTASGGDRPRLPPREAPPESTTPAAPPRRVTL